MFFRRSFALLAATFAACSSASTSDLVTDGSVHTRVDAASSVDARMDDRWGDVDELVAKAVRDNGVSGLGFVVYDRSDRAVFQKMYGDFTSDRRVAIASASKLVSGLVLLELVDRNLLSLDATTGDVLGWTGNKGDITLRHLLSFTSGLDRRAACTSSVGIELADCVAEIAVVADGPMARPGRRFAYGSTHLHVAARMAEVRTGKKWNEIFREILGEPLGLASDVLYFTAPRRSRGTTNPLVAGGLRASMDDYAKILALAFHRGSFGDVEIASPTLFDEQAREPYPDATIAYSPMQEIDMPYRYGLASWLECATPATGCGVLSSPGAFGFTPWYDRDVGYYAILGMELQGQDNGVVEFSVGLAQDLKPAIAKALLD